MLYLATEAVCRAESLREGAVVSLANVQLKRVIFLDDNAPPQTTFLDGDGPPLTAPPFFICNVPKKKEGCR